MSDETENPQRAEAEAALRAAINPDGPPPEMPPLTFAGKVRLHALIAVVTVATLLHSVEGPLWIILGGAATSAVHLYGFIRLNPRYVGIELIGLTLIGYFALPDAPVYWMLGSAIGGGTAAILTGLDALEDDHFFVPALGAAAATLALFMFSQPGGGAEGLGLIATYVDGYRRAIEASLELPEMADLRAQLEENGNMEIFRARVGLVAVCMLIGLWVIVMWIFGRFARRRLGRIRGIFSSLIFFHIRPGYTFLLIVGLIFEILAVWSGREGLHGVSYPLFAICAAAFGMVYVGILLFMTAVKRVSAGRRPSIGFSMLIALGLILSVYIGPAVGLADVWLDFRKTRQIRGKFT